MSIVTKAGDTGTTALMYNRRISKCHPRVDAYGTIDELNAALGMARAAAAGGALGEGLLRIQNHLVGLMGELATAMEDLPRYTSDGYPRLTPEATAELETWVHKLEAEGIGFKGWAMPGDTPVAAALDLARTVCRRAERRVCALQEQQQLGNGEMIVYLNRLSDLLWLLARSAAPTSTA